MVVQPYMHVWVLFSLTHLILMPFPGTIVCGRANVRMRACASTQTFAVHVTDTLRKLFCSLLPYRAAECALSSARE